VNHHSIRTLALLLVTILVGCSVIDGGDLNLFEELVKTLPHEDRMHLKEAAKADMTRRVLEKKDPRTRVIRSECRERDRATDPWGPWKTNISGDITVADILDCFLQRHSYASCIVAGELAVFKEQMDAMSDEMKKLVIAGTLDCRPQTEAEFQPGSEEIDKAVEDISWEDVFGWLLRSPVPPHGFSPSMWQALAPMLCGATTWGCAGGGDLDGIIITVPGSTGGDP
jgi:hypothetical protein